MAQLSAHCLAERKKYIILNHQKIISNLGQNLQLFKWFKESFFYNTNAKVKYQNKQSESNMLKSSQYYFSSHYYTFDPLY